MPPAFVSYMMFNAYDKQIVSQRTDELFSYSAIISSRIVSSGYLFGQDAKDVEDEIEEMANIYQGRIMVVDRDMRIVKDTYGVWEGKTLVSTDAVQCLSETAETRHVSDLGDSLQLTMPIVDSQRGGVCGVIAASCPMGNLRQISKKVAYRMFFIFLGTAVVVLFASFAISIMIARPMKKVADLMDDISEGDMSTKLHMRGYSELVTISEAFNRMIEIIQNQENSRQEFVSNVSHELKTPIASMKVLSDSLLSQEQLPEEIYREFLGDITMEIDRMTKIIDDLLSMVKMDKDSAVMQVDNISINELIEQLLKRLRPIAEKRDIELIFESFRPVMADVDEVKISIALNNIIENAIKYNYDGGWVRVTLNADHKFFFVTVQDSGIGIPDDAHEAVFERFYRVDKTRSRETGGNGLGLALTKSVVALHKGSIRLYSKEKEGTTFTVRIPLNYTL